MSTGVGPCQDQSITTRDLTIGLVVLMVLLVGVQRSLEPATWALAYAVRAIGPISGWRCAQSQPYVYDPRRERADSGLIAEPPEDLLNSVAPEQSVERVEVDLRGGETTVWTRLGAEADGGPQRVYVLSPGRMQAVTFEYFSSTGTLCMSHLADWQIVAEHTLG
jgi:hypothetical protein